MEIAIAIRQLWRYRLWFVPVVAIAIVAALSVTHRVSLLPPSIHSKSFEYGAASTQVLVDTREASLADLETPVERVVERASLYASLLNTQPVRKEIGKIAGLPWPAIAVSGQTGFLAEPKGDERSTQLVQAGRNLTLFFTVSPGQPTVDLYAQAPTAAQAARLAEAAVKSLSRFVKKLEVERNVPEERWVEFKQLGTTQAGTLATGAGKAMGILVFFLVLIVGSFLILFIPRLILDVRKAGAIDQVPFQPSAIALDPAKSNGELSNGSSGALDPGPKPADHA